MLDKILLADVRVGADGATVLPAGAAVVDVLLLLAVLRLDVALGGDEPAAGPAGRKSPETELQALGALLEAEDALDAIEDVLRDERLVLPGLLCAALNMALRRGMIERSPVPAVRRLREDNERDRTLTRTEEEQVLGRSANWLRPMIVIALNTGMREGEIAGLKWVDADLEKGFIRVSHAGKSHKVRHVPINAAVREILDRPSAQAETVTEFVFVNTRKGVPYRADSVYPAFKRAALRAGLDDVVFHTLRHTCVSRLVQAGVPDRKIMKMVGHSSPHMVSRYTHLAPDSLKGVADVLMDGGDNGARRDSDGAAKPSPTHRGRRRAKEQHGKSPESPGSSSVA